MKAKFAPAARKAENESTHGRRTRSVAGWGVTYSAIGSHAKARGIDGDGGYDIVEGHHYVGSYVVLVIYAILGTEEHSIRTRHVTGSGGGRTRPLPPRRFNGDVVVVDDVVVPFDLPFPEGIFERHPLLSDFRQLEERYHLKSPAVRQYVPIPSHEIVQPSPDVPYQFRPGLQCQMVRIRQYYAIVKRIASRHVHRRQSLQSPLGTHGHEHRR